MTIFSCSGVSCSLGTGLLTCRSLKRARRVKKKIEKIDKTGRADRGTFELVKKNSDIWDLNFKWISLRGNHLSQMKLALAGPTMDFSLKYNTRKIK